MSKLAELQKLDRIVRDGEIRLRTIKASLEGIEKEIDTLSTMEVQVEENVKCLKKRRIVAIALEFKKAKEELARVRAALIQLKNTRENYRKSHAEVEQVMKKASNEFDKLQNGGDDNVLRGKFGRKKSG